MGPRQVSPSFLLEEDLGQNCTKHGPHPLPEACHPEGVCACCQRRDQQATAPADGFALDRTPGTGPEAIPGDPFVP